MDSDASDILKNQIIKAQDTMKIEQSTTIAIKALYSCSQRSKTFKAFTDLSNHINSKHIQTTSTLTFKISKSVNGETKQTPEPIKAIQVMTDPVDTSLNRSKCSMDFSVVNDCSDNLNIEYLDCMTRGSSMSSSKFDRGIDVLQKHTNSGLPERIFTHFIYCQHYQKEFTSTIDHLEHFQNEHAQVNLTNRTLETFFTNPAMMQCPKSKSTTIVYMLLESTLKQICITYDTMNHCPYQACRLEAVNYDFEEFRLHTIKEHTSAPIRLECCNPMMMYTPEEYKKHIPNLN